MARPTHAPADGAWTEARLGILGPDEYDFQEFKGSAWMVAADGSIEGEFAAHLSKQLSAFANAKGGRIVLGLDDEGRIDGGVPVDLKGGGTRSWLEDIVSGLVDPALAAFNVHEVLPQQDAPSAIRPGHAVYVIEVPASDAAPHQAVDLRYYLRIAGKSRPMGHVHVQDVLRRTHHPRIHLRRVAPYGTGERITTDPRGPKVQLALRVYLENRGRTLAEHVGLQVEVPRPLVNRAVRQQTLAEGDVQLTQRPGAIHYFRYHPMPVFPGQDLCFLKLYVVIHRNNVDALRAGVARIAWRIFADDAPPRDGQQVLGDFAVVRDAIAWVEGHPGA